jgi:hypothetical protein
VAAKQSKPRIASYGLYVIDPAGVAIRAWLDYRKRVVCTVSVTLQRGYLVWAYCLHPGKQQLAHDLVAAVTRAGYCCFVADPLTAVKKLEVRYDCQNPWPISAGETAGIRCRDAKPGRRRHLRRPGDAGMYR